MNDDNINPTITTKIIKKFKYKLFYVFLEAVYRDDKFGFYSIFTNAGPNVMTAKTIKEALEAFEYCKEELKK